MPDLSFPLRSRFLARALLAICAVLTTTARAATAAANPPPRPNIILLLPDQMRASAMGVAGKLRGELDAQLAALMTSKRDAWSFNSQELVEEDTRLYGKATYYSIQE